MAETGPRVSQAGLLLCPHNAKVQESVRSHTLLLLGHASAVVPSSLLPATRLCYSSISLTRTLLKRRAVVSVHSD